MLKFNRRSAVAAGLILIAYVVSLSLRYDHFQPPEQTQWGYGCDASTYWDLAGNLLHGKGFVDSPGLGHAFTGYANLADAPNVARMPGYPFALMLFRIAYDDVAVAYFLNVLCFLAVVLYARGIARQVAGGSEQVVWITAFLVFSPIFLVYLQGVQSDLFSTAAIVGFVYHFYALQSTARLAVSHFVLAALFGCAAVLSRANVVAFIIPFVGLELFCSRSGARISLRALAVTGLVLLAGAAWGLRNETVGGYFRLSNQLGNNLFLNYVYYRAQPGDELFLWKEAARTAHVQKVMQQGGSPARAEFEIDDILKQKTIEYLLKDLRISARWVVTSIVGVFTEAYFDIADIIAAKTVGVELADNHVVKAPEAQPILRWMRIFSSLYRKALFVCFASFPFIFIFARSRRWRLIILWIASSTFIVATGVVINSGDRLIMPVYAFAVVLVFAEFALLRDIWRNIMKRLRPVDPLS